MRRATTIALVLALLLALLLPLAAIFAPGQAGPSAASGLRVTQVDTADYPMITLYVAANDASGQPQLGLSRDAITITEDGVPVPIAEFDGGGGSINTVLVLDRSGSMDDDDKMESAQQAAAAFADLMRPGDRTALIAFDSNIDTVQGFSGNPGTLRSAIGSLDAEGGTALYDAVIAGVDLLRDAQGRRALIVLSDGADCREPFDGCEDEYGSTATLNDAIDYATEAAQPIYVVGLGDRDDNGDGGIDEEVLRQIATSTNGDYFYAPEGDELANLYTRLAGAIQSEYRLSYTSPRPSYDGTQRDIQVSVGGESAAVGYTERHLINVVSNPLVGVALLTPLLGLLAVPALRRRAAAMPAPSSPSAPPRPPTGPLIEAVATGPAGPAAAPPRPVAVSIGEAPRCQQCDRPLRPGARFCSGCGSAQMADDRR